jgi:hypothetical protein
MVRRHEVGATWPWQQQSPPVVEELASPAGRAVYSSTASKPARAPRGVADTRHARSWRAAPGVAGWPPVGQPVPAWGPPSCPVQGRRFRRADVQGALNSQRIQ